MLKTRCVNCGSTLKEIKVKMYNAESLVTSYQCGACGYFDFENKSVNKVLNEIKKKITTFKIK